MRSRRGGRLLRIDRRRSCARRFGPARSCRYRPSRGSDRSWAEPARDGRSGPRRGAYRPPSADCIGHPPRSGATRNRGSSRCVMLVAVGPEELGRQLRRARQHMGFSLRDVHAVTAIPCPAWRPWRRGGWPPSRPRVRPRLRALLRRGRASRRRPPGPRALALSRRGPSGGRRRAAAPGQCRGKRLPARTPRAGASNGRRPSSLATLRQPDSPWVPKPGRLARLLPALERVAIVALVLVLGVGMWDLERGRTSHKPRPRRGRPTLRPVPSPPPPSATPSPAPTPAAAAAG